jgi:hypothetical protein
VSSDQQLDEGIGRQRSKLFPYVAGRPARRANSAEVRSKGTSVARRFAIGLTDRPSGVCVLCPIPVPAGQRFPRPSCAFNSALTEVATSGWEVGV